MRSEYIHISSFWGLGIFLKENICGTKIWPPKKNQAYFPGVGNTGTSWSLVGSTISFQTWHQLGWRSDSFPQPSDWFIRSTCLYKGQGFCFSILAKGYISSNQVFFWKHIKICRFLGKRFIQQNEFFWVPDIRSKLPTILQTVGHKPHDKDSKREDDKSPPLNIPSPKQETYLTTIDFTQHYVHVSGVEPYTNTGRHV